MGRKVIAEEQVESELRQLSSSPAEKIGLLIGQVTAQKDFVSFTVPTPSVKELSLDEADAKTGSSSSSFFEDWLVLEHARQVSAMLPGGLSVVGIFLTGSPEVVRSLHPRLRKLLGDLCSQHTASSSLSSSSSFSIGLPSPPHMSRILLHICTKTKKYKCQTVDLLDSQAGFRPAELEFQPHSSKWHKVECPVHLHVDTHIPNTHKNLTHLQNAIKAPPRFYLAAVEKNREKAWEQNYVTNRKWWTRLVRNVDRKWWTWSAGLRPILESFAAALVTVQGKNCQSEDQLVKSPPKKRGQPSPATSGETLTAAMYLRKPPQSTSPSSPQRRLQTPSHLRLKGSMNCFAYVHPKATCGEAITAIKQDAVRSLLSRLNSVSEEIQAERLEVKPETIGAAGGTDLIAAGGTELELAESCSSVFASRQLPRRVSVTVPTTALVLCDYCFPDESEEDCKGRVNELLGVCADDVKLSQLEEFPVIVDEPDTSTRKDGPDTRPTVDGPDTSTHKGSALPLISLVTALAVALIAIAVWALQKI